MAEQTRKAQTMKLGTADYAKVAERLRLFRNDFPHSKTESAYEFDVDKSITFTVWVWKDKADLLDLMKNGVTDKDLLRSSSDANGNAKSQGEIGSKAKDFEKLETIALGRALGMLGYLASGEIASFEEQQEFEQFRSAQTAQKIKDAVLTFAAAKTLEDLKQAFKDTGMMDVAEVVAAKDKRKVELTPATEKPKTTTKPSEVAKSVEHEKHSVTPPALPLEPNDAAD